MDVAQQCRRAATVLAHVYDFCKEIKQSIYKPYAGHDGIRESLATFPNVPVYTTEQVIALELSLSNATYYGQPVSSEHALNYFSE